MTVIGPDQLDLDRDVGKAYDARPERRNEELRVGPFVVHVLDAVLGLVVLNAEPGLLASPPLDGSAGEGLVRAGIAEDTPVEFGGHAVLRGVGRAADHLAGGNTVGLELGEPRTKARVDVTVQDVRGGVDVRVGVERAQPASHDRGTHTIDETSPNSRQSLRHVSPPSSLR